MKVIGRAASAHRVLPPAEIGTVSIDQPVPDQLVGSNDACDGATYVTKWFAWLMLAATADPSKHVSDARVLAVCDHRCGCMVVLHSQHGRQEL